MIEPLKNRVLVQKPEPVKFTESGLSIPEGVENAEPVQEAVILALGKEADNTLSVGDKILFGKREGVPVDAKHCNNEERCLMITDNQIRCTLTDA